MILSPLPHCLVIFITPSFDSRLKTHSSAALLIETFPLALLDPLWQAEEQREGDEQTTQGQQVRITRYVDQPLLLVRRDF